MIVVNRFRVEGQEPTAPLRALMAAFGESTGHVSSELGRNLDDSDLWVLITRWADVGSYRRALSGYDVKMALLPMMAWMIDEPSAYELGGGNGVDGGVWNVNIPR